MDVGAGGAGLGHGVEDGEVELLLLGVEVDEQVIDLVEDLLGAGIGAVNLVDDDDGLQTGFQSLAEDVTGLGQRSLGGIDQQHDAIDHLESALHLAAKVGVAGGVHNVDLAAVVVDGGVLGQNRDAALTLQIVGVHDAIGDLFIGAKGSGLAKHGVDKSGLAVVDMGDDGDVANRLAQREIPFMG